MLVLGRIKRPDYQYYRSCIDFKNSILSRIIVIYRLIAYLHALPTSTLLLRRPATIDDEMRAGHQRGRR
jgi:hypothetical protein